jgi:ATP-dependent Clp protease ATP-binding subunit ClpC
MLFRFSDRARKALELADQEARRFQHEYIGTEHLLLGLLQAGPGVGVSALTNLNVDLDRLRHQVEVIMQPGPGTSPRDPLPMTPRSKKALEFAMDEARRLKQEYVGTEHLLLGLRMEQEGVAAAILANFGVELETLRDETVKVRAQRRDQQP